MDPLKVVKICEEWEKFPPTEKNGDGNRETLTMCLVGVIWGGRRGRGRK